MERIDLLWDAWEDCLCKEQLRAEFDSLTTENEKLKATPVAKLYMEAVADRFELLGKLHQAQAQLDKICAQLSIVRSGLSLNCSGAKGKGRKAMKRCYPYDSERNNIKR